MDGAPLSENKYFTGSGSLSELPLEELTNIAESYPYFAPVQLALAFRLKDQGQVAFDRQCQKTAVYFNNPLWLEFLVTEHAGGTGFGRKGHWLARRHPGVRRC